MLRIRLPKKIETVRPVSVVEDEEVVIRSDSFKGSPISLSMDELSQVLRGRGRAHDEDIPRQSVLDHPHGVPAITHPCSKILETS